MASLHSDRSKGSKLVCVWVCVDKHGKKKCVPLLDGEGGKGRGLLLIVGFPPLCQSAQDLLNYQGLKLFSSGGESSPCSVDSASRPSHSTLLTADSWNCFTSAVSPRERQRNTPAAGRRSLEGQKEAVCLNCYLHSCSSIWHIDGNSTITLSPSCWRKPHFTSVCLLCCILAPSCCRFSFD